MALPPQILTHLQEAAEPALMLFGPTASGKSVLLLAASRTGANMFVALKPKVE